MQQVHFRLTCVAQKHGRLKLPIHFVSPALNKKTSRADQRRMVSVNQILDNFLFWFPKYWCAYLSKSWAAQFDQEKRRFRDATHRFRQEHNFSGISSKIVVSALFSIMRDQVEQLKRAGLSAKTIGILTIHMVRDGPLEKWYWGGGVVVRQEIKIPRKLLIKIYIPTDFGQKNMPKEDLCR